MRLKLVMFAIMAIASIACEPPRQTPQEQQYAREQAQALEVCTKAGGFVVRSAWDGRIIDCKIPNGQK